MTLNAQQAPEGLVCRQVSEVGALIEKVKIFDAGLDDLAMEICKEITCREMGQDLDLKFLGITGADGEITLTYPKDGQMQMLQVPHNVYASAQAILSRNPGLVPQGLAKVDSNYVKLLMG